MAGRLPGVRRVARDGAYPPAASAKPHVIDPIALRARFDEPAPLTVGLEEEVMLLDGETLDLAPVGAAVLAAAPTDALFKLEMPAAQLELAADPAATVAGALTGLRTGRRALAAAAAAHGVRPVCTATHPFASAEGPLNEAPRYAAIEDAHGTAARRQLLSALHVHVCVRGADRALAVYNALRSHLPDVAALAGCAPYYEGRDTGLASIRPLLAALLPRQGIPPALPSWDLFTAGLEAAGDPGAWWWELRPHRLHGTLELRVPDVQATLRDTGAVAATVHALVAWLAERHDEGDLPPAEPTWRIDERRWAALRHGPAGREERLSGLLDVLTAHAERLGCAAELGDMRALLAEGGPAARLRAVAQGDVRIATVHLAESFLDGVAG